MHFEIAIYGIERSEIPSCRRVSLKPFQRFDGHESYVKEIYGRRGYFLKWVFLVF